MFTDMRDLATFLAALLPALATTCCPAQDPEPPQGAAEQPDGTANEAGPSDALKELAARVRAHHWVTPRDAPVDRFAAELQITPDGPKENRIEVQLQARFVMPRYLRFKLVRPNDVVEGGLDEKGAWSRENDQLTDLERGDAARDFADQRRATNDYVRLARQLLQFLDPAGTILSLQDPEAPDRGEFRFGRGNRKGVVVVGRLDRYPFFAPVDPERTRPPAQLTLWFTEDEAELFAVQAQPLGDDGLPVGPAELVIFQDCQVSGGLRLPSTLDFYRMGAHPERLATIRIGTIDPDPELTPKLLDRGLPWR